MNFVNESEMQSAAAQSYTTLLKDPSTKVLNNADAARVKRIGQKIAAMDAKSAVSDHNRVEPETQAEEFGVSSYLHPLSFGA